MNDSTLKVSEIFFSLQGEGRRTGLPTTFVRLTGCPLRCSYCDTQYAFQGGIRMTVPEVLANVRARPGQHVCVTGGEPLAQKNCLDLLGVLCDAGYDVVLETSGAFAVGEVDSRVSRIVDIKTPASGEAGRNVWENLDVLNVRDEVKFVLMNADDYRWACEVLTRYRIDARCEVLFSPAYGSLAARDLAEWILRDGLPVRMQIQLHKQLWGEEPGR